MLSGEVSRLGTQQEPAARVHLKGKSSSSGILLCLIYVFPVDSLLDAVAHNRGPTRTARRVVQ